MTLTCHVDNEAFLASVLAELQPAKIACQSAMANRFATIVHHNFGMDGEDRPEKWPLLKPRYAALAHKGDRTPTLILGGDLQNSIQIDEANPNAALVFTENSYAMTHQVGGQTEQGYVIPARPFFPIMQPYGESVTAYTTNECVAAAETEFERVMK